MPKFLDAPNWYDEGGNILSPQEFNLNGNGIKIFGSSNPSNATIWGPTSYGLPYTYNDWGEGLLSQGYEDLGTYYPPAWKRPQTPLFHGFVKFSYSGAYFVYSFVYPATSISIEYDSIKQNSFSGLAHYMMTVCNQSSTTLSGFGVRIASNAVTHFLCSASTSAYQGKTDFKGLPVSSGSLVTLSVIESQATWSSFDINATGSYFGSENSYSK